MKLNTILVHNIESDWEEPGDEANHFAMLDFLSDINQFYTVLGIKFSPLMIPSSLQLESF